MYKPSIAIATLSNKDRKFNLALPTYAKIVIEVGGLPVILPTITDENEIRNLANKYDGFLITAGEDINPKLYGKEEKQCCNNINNERDFFEGVLIEEILKLNKPLLAIGRGCQILNIKLGKKLDENVKIQKSNNSIKEHNYNFVLGVQCNIENLYENNPEHIDMIKELIEHSKNNM